MIEILCGLEVECALDETGASGHNIGGYHHRSFPRGTNWSFESDASLRGSGAHGYTSEIVSRVCKAKQVPQLISELRELVHDGSNENLTHIRFNSSCGAHIHLATVVDGIVLDLSPIFTKELRESIRNEFWARLRADRNLSAGYAEGIIAHYFRAYAAEVRDFSTSRQKYEEFNISSPHYGVEWRSVNLIGAKTWYDVLATYQHALDSYEKNIKAAIDGKTWTQVLALKLSSYNIEFGTGRTSHDSVRLRTTPNGPYSLIEFNKKVKIVFE